MTKVTNDEARMVSLGFSTRARAGEMSWAVDSSGRSSTLLLVAHDHHVVSAPGPTGNRMSSDGRNEGETDDRHVHAIGDQAHMRRDCVLPRERRDAEVV
ncbi:hypothetical protein ACIOTI_43145 [Streptomyces sp. NPDC087843]|uniref:hypothetical protein n=1 Tax=Streptomyces sp. NPDC087843 TaxID=3365804 RepID=UPI0037FCAC59